MLRTLFSTILIPTIWDSQEIVLAFFSVVASSQIFPHFFSGAKVIYFLILQYIWSNILQVTEADSKFFNILLTLFWALDVVNKLELNYFCVANLGTWDRLCNSVSKKYFNF